MNKTQLVDAIAEEAGISKASSKVALDAVLKVIADSLKSGDEVSIVGFGAFKISERKARMGKNPRTHEPMEIPAKNVVKFKPGADLQL
ncbi:MAG: DNA-binding protein [Bacteroidetes bacterium]|nr:MAG: DNA-binding protein [Bacteroidota bacterium]